jgi:hypothetical protein
MDNIIEIIALIVGGLAVVGETVARKNGRSPVWKVIGLIAWVIFIIAIVLVIMK